MAVPCTSGSHGEPSGHRHTSQLLGFDQGIWKLEPGIPGTLSVIVHAPELPENKEGIRRVNQKTLVYERRSMSESTKPSPADKITVAVIKGGPEFQSWFKRLQELTRLPAALVLDASLVAYSKSIGFEEPPPR